MHNFGSPPPSNDPSSIIRHSYTSHLVIHTLTLAYTPFIQMRTISKFIAESGLPSAKSSLNLKQFPNFSFKNELTDERDDWMNEKKKKIFVVANSENFWPRIKWGEKELRRIDAGRLPRRWKGSRRKKEGGGEQVFSSKRKGITRLACNRQMGSPKIEGSVGG